MTAETRTSVFISYSHDDKTWLERLQKHLKPLERDYEFDIWADTRIKPGQLWRQEIYDALARARVAVLLVSDNFMASEFIFDEELPPLLAAAAADGTTILPVIIAPSLYGETPSLSCFQAINLTDKPLCDMSRGQWGKILVKLALAIKEELSKETNDAPLVAGPNIRYELQVLAHTIQLSKADKEILRATASQLIPGLPIGPDLPALLETLLGKGLNSNDNIPLNVILRELLTLLPKTPAKKYREHSQRIEKILDYIALHYRQPAPRQHNPEPAPAPQGLTSVIVELFPDGVIQAQMYYAPDNDQNAVFLTLENQEKLDLQRKEHQQLLIAQLEDGINQRAAARRDVMNRIRSAQRTLVRARRPVRKQLG